MLRSHKVNLSAVQNVNVGRMFSGNIIMWFSRGGGKISEVGVFLVIWKLLYIETSMQKDFSQKSVFCSKIDFFLKGQKRISQKVAGIGKSWRSMTPSKIGKYWGSNFFNFFEFQLLSEIWAFCHFWGPKFSSKILTFEKNPFAWKFLYIKAFIWPGIPLLLRFCHHP